MISLLKFLDGPWDQAKGYLRDDLDHLESALNQRWGATFGDSNLLNVATTVTGTLGVDHGGTGAVSFTAHGVLLGEGTSALGVTAAGTTGNALIGVTGADPVYGKIGLTTHVSGTLPVANGGTGATTLLIHGILLGNTTGAIATTAVGATGTVLVGNTGADPSFSTSVSVTSGTFSSLTATRVVFAGVGGLLSDDADMTFVTDTLTATKIVAPTSVSTPSLISTGALTITPLAGTNLNVALSTTGDFAVNTTQLYVDTSTAFVGIGVVPTVAFHVKNSGAAQIGRLELVAPPAALGTVFEGVYTTNPGFGTHLFTFQGNADGGRIGFAFGQAATYTNLGVSESFQIWSRNAKLFYITDAGAVRASVTISSVANDSAMSVVGIYVGSSAIQHTIITGSTYAPVAAKTTFAGIKIGDTINQSVDTSTTYGLFVDPVLTSAADFRGIGINSAGAYGIYQSSATPANYFAGKVGLGVTGPTAVVHLKAGTATANTAPLKFNSGTLLTTAEAGAVEFLTDKYYGTITTGAARKTFAFLESPALVTPDIGAATGTSLSLSNTINLIATGGAPTSGTLTMVLGTKTVNTTAATATCLIFFQRVTAGGTIGFATTYTKVNNTSFTVSSDSALDTSVYNWWIVETH